MTASLPLGPGEAFLIPELVELRRQGHELTIVPVRPRTRLIHADAEELLAVSQLLPVLSPRVLAAALRELSRAPGKSLRAAGALTAGSSLRVLLKNVVVYPKGLWLARLARRTGTEHIHAHWGSTSATVALVAGQVAGVPWSFTVHRWDIREDNLLALKAGKACFVRAISDSARAALSRYVRDGRARVIVIHLGVRFDARLAARTPARDGLHMLCAANLGPVKGHVYLLEAVRMLKDRGHHVLLDLVGQGPLRGDLRRRVSELGLDREVAFLGQRSHRELLAELASRRWDVATLASAETNSGETEGIPVSLIEAMSAGIPVVSTATGGIPELLRDSAGLLVPPRNPAALAEALEHLALDPEARQHLGEAGRKRVEEEFSVRATAHALVAEFDACKADSRGL